MDYACAGHRFANIFQRRFTLRYIKSHLDRFETITRNESGFGSPSPVNDLIEAFDVVGEKEHLEAER